jgi:hypothetical protein
MTSKLLPSQIDSVRKQLVAKQGGKCAICRHPFSQRDGAVLDHDHETGFIRGALHRSCNQAEGKLKMKAHFGHKGILPYDFLIGLGKYLEVHKSPQINALHPTHQTPTEKRAAVNTKTRVRRKVKKASEASITAAEANKKTVRANSTKRKKNATK